MSKIFNLVFLLLAGAVMTYCSSSSDSASSYSYQGAGSRWSASFTGGNFVITHFPTASSTTADMTVNGTYVDYSTGFRKLTVTSATGSGAPSAGAEAYGFEVPGFAFFLKPIGSDSEPIVMIQSGTCPTSGFDGNWIVASFDASVTLNSSKDSFGSASFTFNGASSSATINQLDAATAGSLGTQTVTFDSTTCSNGVLSFPGGGGDTVDMFFTTNGGALVHSYDGASHDNIIFAAPKNSVAVTQAALAGTYSMLVFDDSNSSNKLFPAKVTIPSSGSGTGQQLTDIATDTVGSGSISISSIAAVAASPGLFTATVDSTGRISCAHFTFNGTKVIACNGYGAIANNNKPFFFLGKSR